MRCSYPQQRTLLSNVKHSTEAAVLLVLSDTLEPVDGGEMHSLVLLHLSAFFDHDVPDNNFNDFYIYIYRCESQIDVVYLNRNCVYKFSHNTVYDVNGAELMNDNNM